MVVYAIRMRNLNAWLGGRLIKKRNFLIFSVLTMGLGSATILIWNFGRHVDVVFSIILFFIGLGVGLLWGVLMWEFYCKRMIPPDKGGEQL